MSKMLEALNLKNNAEIGLGGQGRCERRIEVFVKIQKKKIGGGGRWGGRGRVGGSEWM